MDTHIAKKRVNSTHAIYDKNQPKRDLFRAVIGGTDTVREGGETYLPKYPAEDPAEYKARLKASTIDGVVSDGHEGLVGKVFHEDPDLSKVTIDQAILDNIDNEGNNFSVFARRAFHAAFDGHAVIVVDAPKADGVEVKSLEDEKRLGIRPYWRLYEAKDVINWRYDVDPITRKTKLGMLVLKEVTEEQDGEFGTKPAERYRVYRDNEFGIIQELHRKKGEGDADRHLSEFVMEWRISMPKLTAIPAAIIGELDAEPWLLNEAQLEIKAYQKESSFDIIEYLSIPTLVIIGRDGTDKGQAVPLGASAYLDVPVGGDVKFAQIDSAGHTSLKATIDGIKQEIAGKLDAITKEAMPGAAGDQTATEVVSDDSKSQAKLVVWAQQDEDALNYALQFTGEFMSKKDGGTVELMTAWKVQKVKAEEAAKVQDETNKANIAKTLADANKNGN